MRKVVKLDVLSVARLFVIFYAAVGLFASTKAALTGTGKVFCPFGLEYPYLYLRVNLNVDLPDPPSVVTPFLVLISVVFYAITGAISGTTAAIAYNLTSRFWPGIAATVEPEKAHAEPELPTPAVVPTDPPPTESSTL